MPFDHNDHYHRLLLRHLPSPCRTALDVGCGTGRFARRLAGRGIEVTGLDPSAEVIEAARAEPTAAGRAPDYRNVDVTRAELPEAHYDLVSCLASLHHVPFDTLTRLRAALAPGGVLVVLGCYAKRTPADRAWDLVAVPVNAVARLGVALADRSRGIPAPPRPPVAPPTLSLADVRRQAAELLPGCTVRRLLFWRYLLVYRAEGAPDAGGAEPEGRRGTG